MIIYSTFPFRVAGFQLHHIMLRMIGVVVRHTQKALFGERPVQLPGKIPFSRILFCLDATPSPGITKEDSGPFPYSPL